MRPARCPGSSEHNDGDGGPRPGRPEGAMTGHYVLAIDQGTTSTRCILFDVRGRLVSVAQREHQQHYPHPGWVEHDPTEIWRNVRRLVPQALAQAGVGAAQVAAIGRIACMIRGPRSRAGLIA